MSASPRTTTSTLRVTRHGHAREIEVQAARIAAPRLWLIAAVSTLVAFGIVMVYSASSIKSLTSSGNAQAELFSQLVFCAGGIVVAVLVARLVSYRFFLEKSFYLVCGAIVLLGAVLMGGVYSHGATRWISVMGISIQPSELAKICVIVCLAHVMEKFPRATRLHEPDARIAGAACLFTLALIFIQPDKGTVMVCALALWVMMIADGYSHVALLIAAGIFLCLFLAWSLRDDYARQRIYSMMNPFVDEYGDGYQSVHGFFAFASGGLFGRGLGMSVQKYAYLPEAHNDFILPVIGEELGLVGVLIVFACFAIIGWAGIRIAAQANDKGGRLLAMGCVGLLLGQAMLNFAGVLGVAPLTGKAVPFLSAGGSSMIATMLIVGLLVNVSLNTTLPQTEYDRRRKKLKIASVEQMKTAHAPRVRSSESLTLIRGGESENATSRKARSTNTAGVHRRASSPSRRSANPALRDVSRLARGSRSTLNQGV